MKNGTEATQSNTNHKESNMTSITATVTEDLSALIKTGNLSDVLTALEATKTTEVVVSQPTVAVEISASQREAIDNLPSVYGKVVPTEKRMLQPAEVTALAAERVALDELEKMVKSRREAIRTTVVNHMDEALFANLNADEREALEIDGEGHVLQAQRLNVPGESKDFSWEIRETAASLDADALKALDTDGEIDHDLYLSMTTQVRVIDEMKVMAAIQTNPTEAIAAIAKATKSGKKVGALYVRKAK